MYQSVSFGKSLRMISALPDAFTDQGTVATIGVFLSADYMNGDCTYLSLSSEEAKAIVTTLTAILDTNQEQYWTKRHGLAKRLRGRRSPRRADEIPF